MKLLSAQPQIVDPVLARGNDIVELTHRAGQGFWSAFRALGMSFPGLLEIAESWASDFDGVELPWLCWNVDEDWCFVQQQLVHSAGWTPVVGFDPRVGPPKRTLQDTIVVDFNAKIGLPILYPHFALELAFLYCNRIAFWHSDLLIRFEKMHALANQFRQLRDGQLAAIKGRVGMRYAFSEKRSRYWELVGCTTRAASRDQFEKGCGWWKTFWCHPNFKGGDKAEDRFYWDHGAGIYYWNRYAGGDCVSLDVEKYEEGHFTKIKKKDYRSKFQLGGPNAQRAMSEELVDNFSLEEACDSLNLQPLWLATRGVPSV